MRASYNGIGRFSPLVDTTPFRPLAPRMPLPISLPRSHDVHTMSLLLYTGLLACLPASLAITCMEHGAMDHGDSSKMASQSISASSASIMSSMGFMSCSGQQCYIERDESAAEIQFYRDCVSGVDIKDGCSKYEINGYTVVRCYCSSGDHCNLDDISLSTVAVAINSSALQCSRESSGYCNSYECLYVGKARQCQTSVDEYTPSTLWFGYLWQNTCLHHKLQSGLIDSACRCNSNKCNDNLTDKQTEAMAMNETYRIRPLIKCHFSFEVGGVVNDKYFCIGELCALSEGKGVRTCVNITDLGGADPIKKLGLIDFDNRTYYLCDKSLCNYNGSVAIASLAPNWKAGVNGTVLVPFEGNDVPTFATTFHVALPISMYLMLYN